MITDKHLFDELIYVGPKALVALKDAIFDLYGDERYRAKGGPPWSSEELLAGFLIGLARIKHLRIAVIAQSHSKPNEEFVLGGPGFFDDQADVEPEQEARLIKQLGGRACIYATAIKGDEAMQKGGAR